MYISVGAPKRFCLTPQNSSSTAKEAEEVQINELTVEKDFLVMEKSPCSNFFLTASSSTINLWSMRPTVLLSQVERTEENLEKYGLYVNVYWKPDCTHVAALTSKGYLHIFLVSSPVQNSSVLRYTGDHHWTTGPGQARGAPNYILTLRIIVELKEGCRCALPLNQYILISTVEAPAALFMITWSGEAYANQGEALDLFEALPAKDLTIIGMYHDRSMDLYAFILSDDSILLSMKREHWTPESDTEGNRDLSSSESLSPDAGGDRKVVHFQCIDRTEGKERPRKPLKLSINSRHRLLCVGTTNGDALVYHVNSEFQLFFSHKISKPSSLPEDASISTMAWTSDGNSVAVGYSFGGFCIATAFGRMIFTTSLEELIDPDAIRNEESFLNGVSKMFWGMGNFELFLLPKTRLHNCAQIEIYSIPFAKYAILTCNIRDNMRHPFLIGDNQLLLHSGTDVDSSPFSVNSTVWQVIQIPTLYIAENWPVKFAAASPDGKRIVIAGRRGFAISNLQTGKWKLFGNQQQEKSFMCLGGILWFREYVVVACQTVDTRRNELRIYPANKNLDDANCAFTEQFQRRIICLNILYNHLLVYTADNVINHYQLIDTPFSVVPVSRTRIHCIRAPISVQYIDWFVPAVNENVDEALIKYSSFLILNEGKLSVVDRQLQTQSIQLSTRIEFCWPYYPKRPVGDFYNLIWAFDGSKAKIWFNLLIRDYKFTSKPEDCLVIQLDFYPMSVLFNKGIIVGCEQSLSTHYVDGISFKSIAKSYLFIQDIISHLLSRGLFNEAIRYAVYYQDYDYFGHAMEILVHRVLEHEAETLVGFSKDALLPTIIEFLQRFPHYFDVIVSCARKTEVALWEYLFSIVGDPKELFNQCLETGSLKTATSFLIIIQTLEPFSVSSKLQVDLLEKTLEEEDFELCGEIVRYLNSVALGRGQAIDLSRKSLGQRTGLLAISAEEEQTFYIDILISRHARRLMQTHRLRTLGKLAQSLNFPLEDWLMKERFRTAMITDMKQALRELHQQFEWPFPTDKTTAKRDLKNDLQKRDSMDEKHGAGTPRRRTLPLGVDDLDSTTDESMGMVAKKITSLSRSSSFGEIFAGAESPRAHKKRSQSVVPKQLARRLSHRGDLEQEIRSLLVVTKSAKCYGWALLLATMVLDLGNIVEVLQESRKEREYTQLFDDYKSTLLTSGSLVYQSFVQSVEEVVGLS